MTDRVCVYMDSRIHGILKVISDREKIGMSTMLRVAFIDKFSKFYPDLFSIQDKKIEQKTLLRLLESFEEKTRLKEVGTFENATIMDTIRIIERVQEGS